MRYLFLGVLVGLTFGCTSLYQIDEADTVSAIGQLRVGDKVQVVTNNGEEIRFDITSIREDQLVGVSAATGRGVKDIELPIADIQSISIERLDAVKTGIVGIAAGVGAVIIGGLIYLGIAL